MGEGNGPGPMDAVTVTTDPQLPPQTAYLVSMPYEDWRRQRPRGAEASWEAWLAACVARLEIPD